MLKDISLWMVMTWQAFDSGNFIILHTLLKPLITFRKSWERATNPIEVFTNNIIADELGNI
jgi:hypothetical protein